jgi:capsular polysaccharide transport system ATP-binding protein
MIELRNACKSVSVNGGKVSILDRVDMTFPTGRSVALLGRNGAGKSTLLRVIAGTNRLDSGRILRTGTISWPLGFKGGFQGSMSGAQNVRFVARIYGASTAELVDYVEDFAELGAFYHEPVSSYSSGMRARLAFGLSMGIQFDCYLIDEVTAVGDRNFKKKCSAAFEAKLGRADIIMVSHSTGTIREYCHSGIVMEDGVLTYFDDVEDAIRVHEDNMDAR